eukprot:COSAG06_NODE_1580_length_9031_cov_6.088894_5_plen_118_part_00
MYISAMHCPAFWQCTRLCVRAANFPKAKLCQPLARDEPSAPKVVLSRVPLFLSPSHPRPSDSAFSRVVLLPSPGVWFVHAVLSRSLAKYRHEEVPCAVPKPRCAGCRRTMGLARGAT